MDPELAPQITENNFKFVGTPASTTANLALSTRKLSTMKFQVNSYVWSLDITIAFDLISIIEPFQPSISPLVSFHYRREKWQMSVQMKVNIDKKLPKGSNSSTVSWNSSQNTILYINSHPIPITIYCSFNALHPLYYKLLKLMAPTSVNLMKKSVQCILMMVIFQNKVHQSRLK